MGPPKSFVHLKSNNESKNVLSIAYKAFLLHVVVSKDIFPYQEYLSCYWPDFDETLNVGSWEHLEWIPTVTLTFVICPDNICPGGICPYQEYLSCYWLDFDETLKVGSWEHLEQIPTVMVTFVHATFVLTTYVHISNISAVTDPILMKL